MPDLRDLLRHGLGDVRPDPDALERTRERIRIRRRNRRAGAAGTALTLGLAALVLVWTAFRPTSNPAPATRPTNLIVFSAQAPSDLTPFIQVMDDDGSDVHRLAPGDDPALSADGTSIAFVRTTEVGTGIWVMKPDGSGQRQLTSNPHGMDESPTWSPNGTEIAIDRSTALGTPRRIYVVKIDGTGLEPITDRDWDRFEPAWSPDGSEIAFATAGPGTIESNGNPPQIWVMDADGSDQRQLTTLPFGAWRPAWSPDGSQIAFDGSDGAIYVMNADGSGLRKLGPSIGGFDPTWSPDGNRIAFTGGSDNDHRIFSMNLDGDDVHLLTEAPNATSATSPSWGLVPTLTPPSATQCVQATTSGDFDGDGTVDEAKVIAIVSGVVSCDRNGAVYSHLESQQIQVRFGSGQTLDQPLADCQPCLTGGLVFTAMDLDGNGHDELAIDVGPGAATDYVEFYRVDSGGIRALLVAEPGDPPFIAPGPAILGGGFDSGLWSPIECRVAADGTRELISVHAENVTGPITGPWKVHTTTMVLTSNRLVVASTNDVESKNFFSKRPEVFRNGCS
jgi:dipeptidyl aminopeptidase/acylaminoacyl peptidase